MKFLRFGFDFCFLLNFCHVIITESQTDTKVKEASPGEEEAASRGSRGIPGLKKRISSEEDQQRLISSTPEGEKYFQKAAEVLYEKAAAGEALDVEVRHPGGESSREASESGLVVQPQEDETPGLGGSQILQESDGSHIDIADLSSEPLLAVKPLRRNTAKGPAGLSSFEALYDKTELEEVPGDLALGGEQMRPEDRFQGTRTAEGVGGAGLPGLSSFENIYELPESAQPSHHLPAEELPGARWSAPADTLEPPVLIREEFDQRYGAVRDKIAEHFSDISELVGKEEGGNGGEGARRAEKGQTFICGAPARFACLLTFSRRSKHSRRAWSGRTGPVEFYFALFFVFCHF